MYVHNVILPIMVAFQIALKDKSDVSVVSFFNIRFLFLRSTLFNNAIHTVLHNRDDQKGGELIEMDKERNSPVRPWFQSRDPLARDAHHATMPWQAQHFAGYLKLLLTT